MHLKYATALHLAASVGIISQPTPVIANTQNTAFFTL